MTTKLILAATCVVAILLATPLWAAEGESNSELAKKLQNPIADLISIPFQNNANFGYGPNDNTQNILNIQPVIPFHISKEWNLITRTIVPFIWQPWPEKTFGMGDIQESLTHLEPVHLSSRDPDDLDDKGDGLPIGLAVDDGKGNPFGIIIGPDDDELARPDGTGDDGSVDFEERYGRGEALLFQDFVGLMFCLGV